MPSYQLSSDAAGSLEEIYFHTARTFGENQAEAYHEGFHRVFGLLADFPAMGKSADEFISGWRQFAHGKHLIFYTSEDDVVTVQALIHGAQNVRKHLLDE